MMANKEQKNILNIDNRKEKYQEYEKDFHIRTASEERLINSLPERDDEQSFEDDMYNFGDADDLPDSDRLMGCQTKGIDRKRCLDV